MTASVACISLQLWKADVQVRFLLSQDMIGSLRKLAFRLSFVAGEHFVNNSNLAHGNWSAHGAYTAKWTQHALFNSMQRCIVFATMPPSWRPPRASACSASAPRYRSTTTGGG